MSIDNINAEHRALINVLPQSTRRQQCCSFCRQPGHNIIRCNDNRIREFELLCATQVVTMNTQNEFKTWLSEQDEYLVKVYAIRKFRVSFSSSVLYRINTITNYIYRTYVFNSHTEIEEQADFENDLMSFVQQLASQNQYIRNRIPEFDEVRGMETILIREMMFSMFPLMFTNFIRENLHQKLRIKSTFNNNENEDICQLCECSICYDEKELQNFVKLGCNHEFCKDCVINTIKTSNNKVCCAFCRSEVTEIESRTNEVKNEIDKFIQ
jgi:hypothetical protein